jgi:D-methionine transport system ATP-binding protein
VIRIDGANKTFALPKGEQFHAVKSVTLEVWPGDIFGLIGKSGAGKSDPAAPDQPAGASRQRRITVAGRELTRWASASCATRARTSA